MPNAFAFLVLLGWPIAAVLIAKRNNLPVAVALLTFIPHMFLPTKTSVDLPGLPEISKYEMTSIGLLIAMAAVGIKLSLKGIGGVPRTIIFLMFAGPVFTVFTNQDPLFYGGVYISGTKIYDLLGIEFRIFMLYLVPFMAGYTIYRSEESRKILVLTFLAYMLYYTIPILWEIRMSPQLHTQFYGFFPHSFGQQYRDGGYRAVVFMGHGLEVAAFVLHATVIALIVKQKNQRVFKWAKPLYVVAYMFVIMVLMKSMGALILSIVGFVVLWFFKPSLQKKVFIGIFIVGLSYPALRIIDVVPVGFISDKVGEINAERQQSFDFRINNENRLLEKARQRPLFGWGAWGRNRVYDEITGDDISVTDGQWVVLFGTYGWVGYLSVFGLFVLPSLLFLKHSDKNFNTKLTYGYCLVVVIAMQLMNLIPNSGLFPIYLLFSGAVLRSVKTEFEKNKY